MEHEMEEKPRLGGAQAAPPPGAGLNRMISAFQKRQEKMQALQAESAAAHQRSLKQHSQQQQQQLKQEAGTGGGAQIQGRVLDPANWMQDKDYYTAKRDAQRAPLGMKIKKVIDLLFKERRGLTLEEIENATFVDATSNAELQANLRKNPKVAVEGDTYRYKAKHELKGKEDLLRLIREYKDGLPMLDILDSYAEVKNHVEDLRAAGQIWVLSLNDGSDDTALYPNDPRAQIRVDPDVASLVRSIDLPNDFLDVEKELRRSGQAPTTSAARQKHAFGSTNLRAQQKQAKAKRKRESKRTKFTNAHLPELFQEYTPAR